MLFRIVSGDPKGFYGVSERLTAQQAVSLFLNLVRGSFARELNDPTFNELTLREWVDDPTPHLIYVGDREKWMIAIAPVPDNENCIPSAN